MENAVPLDDTQQVDECFGYVCKSFICFFLSVCGFVGIVALLFGPTIWPFFILFGLVVIGTAIALVGGSCLAAKAVLMRNLN